MKQTPMTQPEKLDLRSHDAAGDKIAELLRLFPEIRTEGGKLEFERLKLALGESVDMGKERYGMNWPGKAAASKQSRPRASARCDRARKRASTSTRPRTSSSKGTISKS